MRHWLLKSDPTSFSFDDLLQSPLQTTYWNGVRNYQARNFLRDAMKKGDDVLFYHSNSDPSSVIGIATIVREGYPDHTQFDPKNHHYDRESDPNDPRWYMVDIRAKEKFVRSLTLQELRKTKGLEKMELLRKGSRLSVQPVTAEEWTIICQLGRGKFA